MYKVGGVAVHPYRPAVPGDRPAIVMVHGGAHAAWCWERFGPYCADRGWAGFALDWFNHGDSDPLPDAEFAGRGIAEVSREITLVTEHLDRPFVLMGHSMGGLAVQCAAQTLAPVALVLLTPVLPAEVGAAPLEVPIDLTRPFPVQPVDAVREMFFSTMSRADVERNHARLQPESARAVFEATRWTVSVDPAALTMPVMTVACGPAPLSPPAAVAGLAELLGAEHVEFPGVGHSDVLLADGAWPRVAERVEGWLRSVLR